jgi:hypothetical protein
MDANSPTHFMTSGYRFCSIMVFLKFPLVKICKKGEIINENFKNEIFLAVSIARSQKGTQVIRKLPD